MSSGSRHLDAGKAATVRAWVSLAVYTAAGMALDLITLDPTGIPEFTVEQRDDLLGGVTVLRGQAAAVDDAGWDERALYRRDEPPAQKPIDVTAIPYALWDNRDPGEMRVWFRTG